MYVFSCVGYSRWLRPRSHFYYYYGPLPVSFCFLYASYNIIQLQKWSLCEGLGPLDGALLHHIESSAHFKNVVMENLAAAGPLCVTFIMEGWVQETRKAKTFCFVWYVTVDALHYQSYRTSVEPVTRVFQTPERGQSLGGCVSLTLILDLKLVYKQIILLEMWNYIVWL